MRQCIQRAVSFQSIVIYILIFYFRLKFILNQSSIRFCLMKCGSGGVFSMDKHAVIAGVTQAAFGKPLVNNVYRAMLAEAIVDGALDNGWHWCSGDWALCDFRHADGTRLEIKQSAARQSWHDAGAVPSKGSFDIAARKMAWDGKRWTRSTGRNAEIYVFAFHPQTDAGADHREPSQWLFYVVPTSELPAGKRITLSGVQGLAAPVAHHQLGAMIDLVRKNRLV